ncbi:MAG: chemotaxis protein CheX, partial [Candidatus Methanosuratincola petrocarbonis]
FAIKLCNSTPDFAMKDLDEDLYYIGILSKISPINTYMLMIIDFASADEMTNLLMNDHIFNFDDFKQSAMQEFCNIVIGSLVSELGRKMGIRIDYTIPLVAVDMPSALIDAISAIVTEHERDQLELKFFSETPPIKIKLIIFKDGDQDRLKT